MEREIDNQGNKEISINSTWMRKREGKAGEVGVWAEKNVGQESRTHGLQVINSIHISPPLPQAEKSPAKIEITKKAKGASLTRRRACDWKAQAASFTLLVSTSSKLFCRHYSSFTTVYAGFRATVLNEREREAKDLENTDQVLLAAHTFCSSLLLYR